VLAFGLLIFYHCAMVYVAEWDYHIKSAHTAAWLQAPMLLLNQWRMSLLFLISGLAMNFLLRSRALTSAAGNSFWNLFGSRSHRLLWPLLFGVLVIVPPQAYVQAVTNGAAEPGYWHFLYRYFTFQPWPTNAFDGSDLGITYNHLWYLPYLWAYTVVLIALLPLLRSARGQALVQRFQSLRGLALWLVPTIVFFILTTLLRARFPERHDFVHDWNSHAQYFTVFVIGFCLGENIGVWQELKRLRWYSLALAVCSYVALMIVYVSLPEQPDTAFKLKAYWVLSCDKWLWLCAVLGWGHHLLNRPFRWLPYATDAVFPWYILHQTFIILGAYALTRLDLGPILEPTLLIGITVGGCLLVHEFVIRRTPWLHPLFGMKTRHTQARENKDGSVLSLT
jgi:peptidoglycan/LPS O-acetylase OafA/YrhL